MRKISLIVCFVAANCAEERKVATELLGTWEDTFMMIETVGSPDDYFVADSLNWERQTGMKPVRRTFIEDGTFRAQYRNLQDSVYAVARGTWSVAGDSLFYRQWEPDTFLATYWFDVKEDTVTFKGLLDWERDGLRNDIFFGTQKRIK